MRCGLSRCSLSRSRIEESLAQNWQAWQIIVPDFNLSKSMNVFFTQSLNRIPVPLSPHSAHTDRIDPAMSGEPAAT